MVFFTVTIKVLKPVLTQSFLGRKSQSNSGLLACRLNREGRNQLVRVPQGHSWCRCQPPGQWHFPRIAFKGVISFHSQPPRQPGTSEVVFCTFPQSFLGGGGGGRAWNIAISHCCVYACSYTRKKREVSGESKSPVGCCLFATTQQLMSCTGSMKCWNKSPGGRTWCVQWCIQVSPQIGSHCLP